VNGHSRGCTCLACCDARRDYQQFRRENLPRKVDAAKARKRIETLLERGLTQREIELRAGIAPRSLWRVRHQERIYADTHDAIMGVTAAWYNETRTEWTRAASTAGSVAEPLRKVRA